MRSKSRYDFTQAFHSSVVICMKMFKLVNTLYLPELWLWYQLMCFTVIKMCSQNQKFTILIDSYLKTVLDDIHTHTSHSVLGHETVSWILFIILKHFFIQFFCILRHWTEVRTFRREISHLSCVTKLQNRSNWSTWRPNIVRWTNFTAERRIKSENHTKTVKTCFDRLLDYNSIIKWISMKSKRFL